MLLSHEMKLEIEVLGMAKKKKKKKKIKKNVAALWGQETYLW